MSVHLETLKEISGALSPWQIKKDSPRKKRVPLAQRRAIIFQENTQMSNRILTNLSVIQSLISENINVRASRQIAADIIIFLRVSIIAYNFQTSKTWLAFIKYLTPIERK